MHLSAHIFNSTWHNGVEYHLHRELVEDEEQDDGTSIRVVKLCRACGRHAAGNNHGPPKYSLAAGIDFGRLEPLFLKVSLLGFEARLNTLQQRAQYSA